MTTEHEKSTIYLKEVEVDTKMIPVVAWLNSYVDTYTLFCCQGGETLNNGGGVTNAYVLFVCFNPTIDLSDIINVIQAFNARYMLIHCSRAPISFVIDLCHKNNIRYKIELSQEFFSEFSDFLQESYIDLVIEE